MAQRALPAPVIPGSLVELTPEWLTGVLRGRGVLKHAVVTGFHSQRLGEGEGFVGSLARLHLELDPPEATAPATLIAKLPTEHVRNRGLAEITGAYEHEILFYEHLARDVGIPTPACYFSAMDPNPIAGREEAFVGFLERLPRWLQRLAIPLFEWLGRRQTRRYVLLLEDLGAGRVGDQVRGCSREELARALRALASAHASWWRDERLANLGWAPRLGAMPGYMQAVFQRSRPGFEARWAPLATRAVSGAVAWLGESAIALERRLAQAPFTLLHGDYRLDNLFFHDGDGDGDGGLGVTALDWQAVARGPAALDVAYFLLGTLAPEVPDEREQALLQLYFDALSRAGVKGYAFESFARDYARAKMLVLYRFVLGIGMLDLADTRRGADLLETMSRRLFARIPGDGLDALLA